MNGPPASPDVLRSCRSKRRYGTKAEADRVGAFAYQERGHWLRAYQCDLCDGGWHLTHKGALPPPGASWRPPAKSQRQIAFERAGRRRRRGRRT